MDARAFLASLERDESLVHLRELPARTSEPGPFPDDVPSIVVDRLGLIGVTGLYAHQRTAFDAVRAGRNVIVATGTASGKTLVYNLSFAAAAVADAKSTALYLFPTKALARDQLRQVRELKLPQIRAAVYDGDTPRAERPLVRRNANLVLSNPDMLHAGILPDHARWADFFLRLSLVVVDEAHVSRGVFGSHVAQVLRRLRRLVAHYGGDARFVLASATVGNPAELAERLVGVPFDAVTEDASPTGEKLFALLNPPVIDEESGARRSALTEASQLVASLAEHGVKSMGFTQVHPGAIYLHQGEQFEVRELDLVGHAALVSRSDPDYYTQARDITDIRVEGVDETGDTSGGVPSFFGTVHVSNQVTAFARKHVATGEILDVVPLMLPPQTLETKAVWWAIPPSTIERASISESALPGAAHAAEHAAIGLLPLVATCDRWDVGGVSTAFHPDTGSCAIFIYDGYPGGAGIAERGFAAAERGLGATLQAIRSCPCQSGCPSCVQSPKCGNGNEPLDKTGAVRLLEAILP